LSIKYLWEQYNKTQQNKNVSYNKYYKVFKNMNIGIGQPSQDDCDILAKH